VASTRDCRLVVERQDQDTNAPEGEQLGGVGFVACLHVVRDALAAALHACLHAPSCFAHDVLQVLNSEWNSFLQSLEHLASADEGARPAPTISTANATTPVVSLLMDVSSRLSLVTVDAATMLMQADARPSRSGASVVPRPAVGVVNGFPR
jgi:hypothetical protein